MTEQRNIQGDSSAGPPILNAHELKGKQSVRATFKLSPQIIELLKVAASHLGVKQKSIIDQLVDDQSSLSLVAISAKKSADFDGERRPKTMVLSRSTLTLLEEMSKRHDVSRDVLIEFSINRLEPFVEAEREKLAARRRLLKELREYREHGRELLRNADRRLGSDDPFRHRLEKIVSYAERNYQEMEKLV